MGIGLQYFRHIFVTRRVTVVDYQGINYASPGHFRPIFSQGNKKDAIYIFIPDRFYTPFYNPGFLN